jgi:hypothetical protein
VVLYRVVLVFIPVGVVGCFELFLAKVFCFPDKINSGCFLFAARPFAKARFFSGGV